MQAPNPLSRTDVINAYKGLLKTYKLRPAECWLGGGSAMIMYGLRETTMDLDAGCKTSTLYKISKDFNKPYNVFSKADGYLHDNTIILPIEEFFTDLHSEDAVERKDLMMVDGVMCYNISTLLKQKQLLAKVLNREKDHKDIAAILKYKEGGSIQW